jgi:hypothetical protein
MVVVDTQAEGFLPKTVSLIKEKLMIDKLIYTAELGQNFHLSVPTGISHPSRIGPAKLLPCLTHT